jgi:NADPH-dependent ferric siderophore reductase
VNEPPRIARVRHELKRRELKVARVERIATQMLRIVLQGPDLQGFTSLGFDDHVKLFCPPSASGISPAEPSSSEARDFTPRRFDAAIGELWIDFFLHEAGPATTWASRATAGDAMVVGGPKGSAVIAFEGIDLHVLIGDETAFPAINRRLEELPPDTRALVVAEVDAQSSWPQFESRAALEVVWASRGPIDNGEGLIERLRTIDFPSERCFVWVALESHAARSVRRYLRDERGIGKDWIKAAAYWKRGAIGTHERIEEE